MQKVTNIWIVVDKPRGVTSAGVVAKVRRLWGRDTKVGHAGTLDPMATGVLPLALGEATKTMFVVADADKAYDFTIAWGVSTTTGDAEGTSVAQAALLRPDPAAIEAVLPKFVGVIQQVPPAYSAIKVAGKRAYALARAGEVVHLAPRPVHIESLIWHGSCQPTPQGLETDRFSVVCGKGTYVRALAADIAEALGTLGHLTALRRTRVGRFCLGMSISLDKLNDLGHSPDREAYLIPIPRALDDIPALTVDSDREADLRHGRSIVADGATPGAINNAIVLCVSHDGRAIALARYEITGHLAPFKVLNT